MVESKQANCVIIVILKYLRGNKQILGQKNWLEVSTTVGQIRNVGWKSLGYAVTGRNLPC